MEAIEEGSGRWRDFVPVDNGRTGSELQLFVLTIKLESEV